MHVPTPSKEPSSSSALPPRAYAEPAALAAVQNQKRDYAKAKSTSPRELGNMWPMAPVNNSRVDRVDQDNRLWQWEVPIMSGDSVPSATSRLLVNALGKNSVSMSNGVSNLWEQLQILSNQVNNLRAVPTSTAAFQDPVNHHEAPYTPGVNNGANPFPLPRHGEMTALQRLHLQQQQIEAAARISASKSTVIDPNSTQIPVRQQPDQRQERAAAFDARANVPPRDQDGGSLAQPAVQFLNNQPVYSSVSALDHLPAHFSGVAFASSLLDRHAALLQPHLSQLQETARDTRRLDE